jgi:hypothetical protein
MSRKTMRCRIDCRTYPELIRLNGHLSPHGVPVPRDNILIWMSENAVGWSIKNKWTIRKGSLDEARKPSYFVWCYLWWPFKLQICRHQELRLVGSQTDLVMFYLRWVG